MAFSSYATLQTAIADWLNRSDLTSVIPDFITLAEARLRRLLRAKGMVTRAALTIDSATEAAPTDMKELRSIFLNGGQGSDYNYALEIVSPERLSDLQRLYSTAGAPKYVSVQGETLYFVPQPDTTYTGAVVYELEVPKISVTDPNWLLTDFPDIYLYGALVEASPYLRDDARVPLFEQRFREAVAELEMHRDRHEYGANTPIVRPARSF